MEFDDVLLEEEEGGESLDAESLSYFLVFGGIYLGDVVGGSVFT
jgi:hypothetical protein